MRELPVDYFGHPGKIQVNGRAVYDVTLYQVKTPAEAKYPWDYFKSIEVMPDNAHLSQSGGSGLPGVGMAIKERQGTAQMHQIVGADATPARCGQASAMMRAFARTECSVTRIPRPGPSGTTTCPFSFGTRSSKTSSVRT